MQHILQRALLPKFANAANYVSEHWLEIRNVKHRLPKWPPINRQKSKKGKNNFPLKETPMGAQLSPAEWI